MPPDVQPQPQPSGKLDPQQLREILTRKLGPFPVWVWGVVVIGGVVGAFLLTRYFGGGSDGDSGGFPGYAGDPTAGGGDGGGSSTTAPPTSGEPPEPSLNGGGGGGGRIPRPSPTPPTRMPGVTGGIQDFDYSTPVSAPVVGELGGSYLAAHPPAPPPIRTEQTVNVDRWYVKPDTAPASGDMPTNNAGKKPKPKPKPAPKPKPQPKKGSGTQKR